MVSMIALIVSVACAFEPPSDGNLPQSSRPAAQPAPADTLDLSPQVTEGVVRASAAEVWAVFTTAEGFMKLGVAKCDLDFRVGGLIRSHYNPDGVLGDEGTIQNQFIAYEPMRMIAFRVHQPPKGFPFPNAWKDTWSVVTLTDLGDGTTHVRLAGLGYDATEESQKMREFFRAGNAYVMKMLQSRYDAAAPAPSGPAHPQRSLGPIEKEIVLPASRDAAWRLFATREGWTSTIAQDARIDLRPGGSFEICFNTRAPKGEQGSEGCTVLSLIPGQMLSYSWNAPPAMAFARTKRTWVVLRFEQVTPTATRVRLTHQGFAELAAESPDHAGEFEDARGYFDEAWGKVLAAALDACGGKAK